MNQDDLINQLKFERAEIVRKNQNYRTYKGNCKKKIQELKNAIVLEEADRGNYDVLILENQKKYEEIGRRLQELTGLSIIVSNH